MESDVKRALRNKPRKNPGGRPQGTINSLAAKAKRQAESSGILPHEWLLMIARGEAIKQKFLKINVDKKGMEISREWIEEEIYPDFPTRVDAAKAVAPFFAPKLATQTINTSPGNSVDKVADALKVIADKLPV